MYITKITIENIRSIEKLEWKIPEDKAAGWHVILGDNGSGKTTFVRVVAVSLIGLRQPYIFQPAFEEYLRQGAPDGRVTLGIMYDPTYDVLDGPQPRSNPFTAQLRIGSTGKGHLSSRYQPGSLEHYPYVRQTGWFNAAYGPSRRLTGGDDTYEEVFRSNAKLARIISAFDDRVALTEGPQWLQYLKFKQLEGDPVGELLNIITSFINQDDFLPSKVRLDEVTSDEVIFTDACGFRISVKDLGDGYRSTLAMTFDLLRHIVYAYGSARIFDPNDPSKIIVPGVVLVDEVDAHLHPSWQRKIGIWFREHFPNMQFIVTTHSPLICQAADVGTVCRLRSSGSDETSKMITGLGLDRLLYGNVLEAYSTEAFGLRMTRSEKSFKMLERLAALNVKELDEDLSPGEQDEQDRLRAILPTAANTLNPNGGKVRR